MSRYNRYKKYNKERINAARMATSVNDLHAGFRTCPKCGARTSSKPGQMQTPYGIITQFKCQRCGNEYASHITHSMVRDMEKAGLTLGDVVDNGFKKEIDEIGARHKEKTKRLGRWLYIEV